MTNKLALSDSLMPSCPQVSPYLIRSYSLKKLTRYTLKELIAPFFLALFCFTFILLLDEIFKLTKTFVQKGVNPRYLVELLIYILPATLVVTIPMATLVGILLAFGRLSADNEITAMKASGIGIHHLLIPILLTALSISIFDLFFMDTALPKGNRAYRKLIYDIRVRNSALILEPGVVMNELEQEGRKWMFEKNDAKTGRLKNVKIWDEYRRDGKPRFITAKEGEVDFSGDFARLKLYDGIMYEYWGKKEIEDCRVTNFGIMNITLDYSETLYRRDYESERPRNMPLGKLRKEIKKLEKQISAGEQDYLKYKLLRAKVEFQKKFAIPFACLAFCLIGVPLGIMVRRSGKMIGAGIGVALIIVYYALLQVGVKSGEKGVVPAPVGVWMPNILIGVAGIVLLIMAIREKRPQRLPLWVSRLFSCIRSLGRRLEFPHIFGWVKILDRYVLREYIRSFLGSFAFFIALVIVVRLFDKEIGHLLSGDMAVSDAIKVVMYKAPARIMQVVPAAASFATFFMLSRFAKNNELAAMKSAGISMYRIVFITSVATFFICIVAAVFNDQIASRASWRSRLLERRIPYYRNRDIIFKGKNNRMYYIQNMDMKQRKLNNLTVYELDEDKGIKTEMFASHATWVNNTWKLKNGVVRDFADGRTSKLTKFEEKEIFVPEEPKILADTGAKPYEMTYFTLAKLVKYQKELGKVVRKEQVEMQHKLAYPFTSLAMVLIAAPLAIWFGKSGLFAGFAITLLLSFIDWGIATATFEALGANGKLPPVVACWAANVIFAIAGGVLIWKVEKSITPP